MVTYIGGLQRLIENGLLISLKITPDQLFQILCIERLHASFCHGNGGHFGAQPQ